MKSPTCLAVSLHAFHCADIDQFDGRRAPLAS
jgi:hypothetical protein